MYGDITHGGEVVETPSNEVGKMNILSEPVYVLYHANCADGFGAAMVAWLVFGGDAQYIAMQYGQPVPCIPEGARVFILDFSFPREVLIALDERCKELVVIDHHKTAREALQGLSFTIFDLEKSGAVLAWEFFRDRNPEIVFGQTPLLLQYVQDRDLWRWELPFSKHVSAALAIQPRDLANWAVLAGGGDDVLTQLQVEGALLLKQEAALVESIVAKRRWIVLTDGVREYQVPVINSPVLISEACHRLLELEPVADIVADYFEQQNPGEMFVERVWELRARPGIDATPIAKHHGGGGHPQACGFTEVLNS